ncbi:MAG: fibronectin type III domain-containing protein [Candidatus Riflebacteria bacterium]|nr:fibronectin type III domain-containing protein [Candidatus Riflebacteria bacterium]
MKRPVLTKLNTSLLLFLFMIGIIAFSGSILMAEDNEDETYFNQKPVITPLSNKSIEVKWDHYPSGDESTHYQVMLDHVYYDSSTKKTRQVCNYLTPGSKVEVRVVTFHKGDFKGISTITEILMPTNPPEFSTYDVATTSFGIIWSGVNTATSYNIYNNNNLIASKTESGINNKMLLTGFEPGETLNISMTAINPGGESPKSAVKVVQLLPVASLTMTIPNTSITSTSFKIKWTKQAYASGYRILINDESFATVDGNTDEYTVSGLNAGTTVSVKIAVMNSAGEAATSESIIVQLKPDAPILTATDISSYSCTLTWSVANGANNYKIFENGDNAIYNVPSTITNVTITENVIPGATFHYKVRAVNDIGESEDSNIVEVTFLPSTSGSESTEPTTPSAAPIFANRVLSSSFNIPEAKLSDSLKEKMVIAVYFPEELSGAELELEEEYLEALAETPEMSNIRFYAIFTNETVKRDMIPENVRFKKAKPSDRLVIPGKIPVVRFYAIGGILRSEILISIPIMTVMDVYKALPEAMEKRSSLTHLYHE